MNISWPKHPTLQSRCLWPIEVAAGTNPCNDAKNQGWPSHRFTELQPDPQRKLQNGQKMDVGKPKKVFSSKGTQSVLEPKLHFRDEKLLLKISPRLFHKGVSSVSPAPFIPSNCCTTPLGSSARRIVLWVLEWDHDTKAAAVDTAWAQSLNQWHWFHYDFICNYFRTWP